MTTTIDIDKLRDDVTQLAAKAKVAASALALVSTDDKNKALLKMADEISAAKDKIIAENKKDVEAATNAGQSKALLDRLTLDSARIDGIAQGLKEMVALADPVGEVLREWSRPNGIMIRQVRVPLGVIGMIYEARPNVTAEAAGLCLKAGNGVILRGGSEAFHSNKILVELIAKALSGTKIPKEAVQFLPPQDRRSTTILSRLNGIVDLVIARGSEEMIKAISADATVPVLGHGKGVCHVYVDKDADIEKAVAIAYNAKVQRPGVCNAMESLLIHEHVVYDMLPKIAALYVKAGVEMRGDEKVTGIFAHAKEATDKDWGTEYHDKIVSIKVVDSLDEAITHINRYGSGHTDSIVTENKAAAALFEKAVDSSCVMVNASTRLHDGGVFGFGSEIGISTQKFHARGTMGLRELTTTKYLVEGTGQIRE
jgi:glutamate-5-semialdehyde dehydrogenase